METFKVVVTFESADEILWCGHSNKTSSAVLAHGTIYIQVFYKMKFGICLEFWFYVLLGVKGLIIISVHEGNETVSTECLLCRDHQVQAMWLRD